MILRASWVQAWTQLPQPMHRSWFMLTLSPEPSMQYLTGQTAMHMWQLTHLSSSTAITGTCRVLDIIAFMMTSCLLHWFFMAALGGATSKELHFHDSVDHGLNGSKLDLTLHQAGKWSIMGEWDLQCGAGR
jgi:hypothetical protein